MVSSSTKLLMPLRTLITPTTTEAVTMAGSVTSFWIPT